MIHHWERFLSLGFPDECVHVEMLIFFLIWGLLCLSGSKGLSGYLLVCDCFVPLFHACFIFIFYWNCALEFRLIMGLLSALEHVEISGFCDLPFLFLHNWYIVISTSQAFMHDGNAWFSINMALSINKETNSFSN